MESAARLGPRRRSATLSPKGSRRTTSPSSLPPSEEATMPAPSGGTATFDVTVVECRGETGRQFDFKVCANDADVNKWVSSEVAIALWPRAVLSFYLDHLAFGTPHGRQDLSEAMSTPHSPTSEEDELKRIRDQFHKLVGTQLALECVRFSYRS